MIDRRELIMAVAASALPLVAAPASSWARTASPAPGIVVFDARYDQARRFAAAFEKSGAVALEAGRDVASLWYGRLQKTMASHPGLRLAGLATDADFQVIRGCAAEARLDLVHHAIHDGRRALHHHVLRGPATAEALAAAGLGWPEALAARLGGATSAPNAAKGAHYPGTLVSWMIG